MDLKNIMSIAGKPGLYKNIAQSKNGVIVESLIDGKRFQAFGSDKISALGEISIYTDSEEKELREVFRLMREKLGDAPALSSKATDSEFVSFFESVLPDYDKERFYLSHMKKVVGWYNLLIQNDITDFSAPEDESPEITREDTSGGTPEKEENKE